MHIKFSYIKNPWVALFALILVLLANLKHSISIYFSITQQESTTIGLIYVGFMVIALDFAVLVFAVHGNKWGSRLCALLIGTMNLYYFWSHLDFPGWTMKLEWLAFLPGLIYSSLWTVGLSYFAEIFTSYLQADERLLIADEKVRESLNKMKKLSDELKELKARKQDDFTSSPLYDRLSSDRDRLMMKVKQHEERDREMAKWIITEEALRTKTTNAIRSQKTYWGEKAETAETKPEKSYAYYRHLATIMVLSS